MRDARVFLFFNFFFEFTNVTRRWRHRIGRVNQSKRAIFFFFFRKATVTMRSVQDSQKNSGKKIFFLLKTAHCLVNQVYHACVKRRHCGDDGAPAANRIGPSARAQHAKCASRLSVRDETKVFRSLCVRLRP